LTADTTYGFDKWRVRKSSGSNPGEIPRMVRAECTTTTYVTAGVPVQFTNIVEDTHSSITLGTGWRFTNKTGRSTVFDVKTNILCATGTAFDLFKNGIALRNLGLNTYPGNAQTFGSTSVRLEPTEYIDIRLQNFNTLAVSSSWLIIESRGN
jgi:hypothetical protein